MKKITIIALFALTFVSAAFADDKKRPDFKGNEQFRKDFPQAVVTKYEVKSKFTVVNFTWNNMTLQAFYDRLGNPLGTSRVIQIKDLPLSYLMNIKNEYPGYALTEAIEFDHPVNGLSYYVNVVRGQRGYVLEITSDGAISVFKKMKD